MKTTSKTQRTKSFSLTAMVLCVLVAMLSAAVCLAFTAPYSKVYAQGAEQTSESDEEFDGLDIAQWNLTSYNNENYTGAVNKGDVYKSIVYLGIETNAKRVVDGKVYYGDSANFHLITFAQEDEVISGTERSRRISWDTQQTVSLQALGHNQTKAVNGQVGSGVMYIHRVTDVHPEGQDFFIHKIFSKAGYTDRNFNTYFEEEGEYEVAIFFETYRWTSFLSLWKTDFQRHVLTYKFNILRTNSKIALIDNELEGNYIQKGFSSGTKDFSVSFNGNNNISVEYEKYTLVKNSDNSVSFSATPVVQKTKITDGYNFKETNAAGSVFGYRFYVYNKAFKTEQFDIVVDSTTTQGNFTNIRRITAYDSLEVEHQTAFSWNETVSSLITIAKYRPKGSDESAFENLSNGQVVSQMGANSEFEIVLRKGQTWDNWSTEVRYFLTVVPADAPTRNKDFLENAHRFNNFIPRWYEVKDFASSVTYATGVYDTEALNIGKLWSGGYANNKGDGAYQMAMSIELTQFVTQKNLSNISNFHDEARLAFGEVVIVGEYFEYFDRSKNKTEIYFDRVNLTHAMDINARTNAVIKNWDLSDGDELKDFHESLFDGTHYLNKDFVFSSKHPTEAEKIRIVGNGQDFEVNYIFNSANGVGYIKAIDFIEQHNLIDGSYVITETDSLGNSSQYQVVLDLSAPVVVINGGTGNAIAVSGQTYNLASAKIVSFSDSDNFALLKVNGNYYFQSEINNLTLTAAGIYEVVAYDRNKNITEFTVILEGDLSPQMQGVNLQSVANNAVKVYVSPYVTTYYISVNGEEVNLPLLQNAEGFYYEIPQSATTTKQVIVEAVAVNHGESLIAAKTLSFVVYSTQVSNESVHSITINTDGHGTATSYLAIAELGESVELNTVADKGYQLKRILINGVNIGKESHFVMPNTNVTVSVEFEPRTYDIYFAEIINGSASTLEQSARFGSTVTLNLLANNGYNSVPIISVNGINISGNTFVMPAEDAYIAVTFPPREAEIQVINISPSQNGTIAVQHGTTQVLAGSEVMLIIIPDSGYRLKSNSLTINGQSYSYLNFVMPNENIVISAEFEIISQAVIINDAFFGNGIIAIAKDEYIIGEIVTITVTPDSGYRLKEGSLKVNGAIINSLSFYMPEGGAVVTAEFEQIPPKPSLWESSIFTITFSIIAGLAALTAVSVVVIAILKRRAA